MAREEIRSDRFRLTKAVALSLFAHLLVFGFLWYHLKKQKLDTAAGQKNFGGAIDVSLLTGSQIIAAPQPTNKVVAGGALQKRDLGEGQSAVSGQKGEGGEGGSSVILHKIRLQIERAKYYPLVAKRSKIEGSPLIEFKIKNDGSLAYVILKKSSGSQILDDAAIKTVHEASPFPFYSDTVALNVNYTLNN